MKIEMLKHILLKPPITEEEGIILGMLLNIVKHTPFPILLPYLIGNLS
jgi:hypothetical protein